MKKILIVEDDQFIRDIYSKVFSISGYEVDTGKNGLEALQKITEQDFDVILLDVIMPDMSGLEVLRQLRTSASPKNQTPVFMSTNIGQQDIVDDAERLGISGYMIKSQLTPQEIVEKINNFISQTITRVTAL